MGEEMVFFTLTREHVELLRHAEVSWNNDEFGAPTIDPKRPYGNSDVIGDMCRVLHESHDPDAAHVEAMTRLHRETATALQVVLDTGAMEPGQYTKPRYSGRWERVR